MNAKNFTFTHTGTGYAFVSPGLKIPVKSLRTGGITIHEMITSGLINHAEALEHLFSLQKVEIPIVSHRDEMEVIPRVIDVRIESLLQKECEALLGLQTIDALIHSKAPFLPNATEKLTMIKTENGIRFTGKGFISAEVCYRIHALTLITAYENNQRVTKSEAAELRKKAGQLLKKKVPGYWKEFLN